MCVHAQTIYANHIRLQLLCPFDYDYTYDSACSSNCIEQSEPAMQHCFSDQIECGYDNDLSVSNLPNADQITPYTADQTFCLKLSRALIFF